MTRQDYLNALHKKNKKTKQRKYKELHTNRYNTNAVLRAFVERLQLEKSIQININWKQWDYNRLLDYKARLQKLNKIEL